MAADIEIIIYLFHEYLLNIYLAGTILGQGMS